MPSPDVSGYVDLTIFDVTAADLVDRALIDVATKAPDMAMPDGSTEQVLLEAQAVIAQEIAFAVNRLPDAIFEVLLSAGYKLTRLPGTPPTADVQFSVGATGGSVPAFTLLEVDVDGQPVQFSTDVDLTIPAGTPSATVPVTGVEASTLANGVAAATPVTVLSDTAGVTAAALSSAVSGGTDPEDGDAFLDRGSTRLQRLTVVLARPEHFQLAALENPAVFRALALDNWAVNIAAAGFVTVVVAGPGGVLLSGATKDQIQADLDALAYGNLYVSVADPTITAIAVTSSVVAKPGFDAATVQANVASALAAYLNPDVWAWGATVYHNELISVIDQAEGVDRVVSITVPAGDVALSGVANLVSLGAVTTAVA